MWIKKISLRNFGKHAALDLDLQKGLVGIFGANGCGKSTITDGAYSALTSDFGRFAGNRADNIHDMAPEGAESYVMVVGEHKGVEFTLKRGLRPNRSELKFSDQSETITASSEIQAELEKRLGVKSKIIDTYVFVQQWNMFSFLSQQAGARSREFQHLCNTTKAEVIYKAISKMLDSEGSVDNIIDNSDELRVRVAARKKDLMKAGKERNRIEKRMLSDEKRDKARSFVQRAKRCVQLDKEMTETETSQSAVVKEAEAAAKERTSTQDLHDQLKVLLADLDDEAKLARKGLEKLEAYRKVQKQRDKYNHQIAGLDARAAELGDEPEAIDDKELQSMRKDCAKLMAVEDRANDILNKFDKEGVIECSECGMPVAAMGDHLQKLKVTAADAEIAADGESQAIRHMEAALAAYDEWHRKHDRLVHELEVAKKHLAALDDGDAPEVDEKAAREVIADLEEQEINLDNVAEKLSSAISKSDIATTRADSLSEHLQKLQREHKEKVIAEKTVANATAALERHDMAATDLAVVVERMNGLTTSIEEDEADIERIELLLSRNVKKIKLRNQLEGMRKIMHHKALPSVVAQRNLEDMEEDINANLSDFADPFWVEAREDLSFDVHFPGEPARPAGRLSGGQKGVLAVAFRQAVSSIFAADVDMMVLDEPTVGMDEKNRTLLAEVLTKFAAKVRGNRQVIIITHAEELRSAFDQVIDISNEHEAIAS